jgi:hypothetical protein
MSETAEEILEKIDRSLQEDCASIGELNDLEQEVSEYIDQGIQDLCDEGENLEEMRKEIADRRDRLDLTSGITDEIIGISKRVLGFGVAGGGLVLAFYGNVGVNIYQNQYLISLAVFLSEISLSSLIVLIMHIYYQRYRYPFLRSREIGNAWQYYYYSALEDESIRHIAKMPSSDKEMMQYMKNYIKFFDRIKSESEKQKLRGEIQQYFLLLYYQAYSNQFTIRLTNTFIYGFTASLISLLAMLSYSIFY